MITTAEVLVMGDYFVRFYGECFGVAFFYRASFALIAPCDHIDFCNQNGSRLTCRNIFPSGEISSVTMSKCPIYKETESTEYEQLLKKKNILKIFTALP